MSILNVTLYCYLSIVNNNDFVHKCQLRNSQSFSHPRTYLPCVGIYCLLAAKNQIEVLVYFFNCSHQHIGCYQCIRTCKSSVAHKTCVIRTHCYGFSQNCVCTLGSHRYCSNLASILLFEIYRLLYGMLVIRIHNAFDAFPVQVVRFRINSDLHSVRNLFYAYNYIQCYLLLKIYFKAVFPITILSISEVPSPISNILASLISLSTGYSLLYPLPPNTCMASFVVSIATSAAISLAIAASTENLSFLSLLKAALYVKRRAASIPTFMSANLNWIAWNLPIGFPKAVLFLA